MATVKSIIERAYTKVNGEYESLVEGSEDFRTYLNVLNQTMEAWATTPYVKWQSLYDYEYRLPDPVAADTFVYDIPDFDRIVLANTPFDSVYFTDTSGKNVAMYKMVNQALYDSSTSSDMCALLGGKLYIRSIKDNMVGTSIRLPVYLSPPQYTSGSQEVKVDSVTWLIAAMAAFICSSSPVPFIARNADRYETEATKWMKTMRDNNNHAQHLTIKRVGQSVDDQRFSSLSQAINAGVGAGGGSVDSIDGGTY